MWRRRAARLVALFLVRGLHAYEAHTQQGRPADAHRQGRLFHHATSSGAGVRDRHGVVAVPSGGGHGHAAAAQGRATTSATSSPTPLRATEANQEATNGRHITRHPGAYDSGARTEDKGGV